eukprot:g9221.t1
MITAKLVCLPTCAPSSSFSDFTQGLVSQPTRQRQHRRRQQHDQGQARVHALKRVALELSRLGASTEPPASLVLVQSQAALNSDAASSHVGLYAARNIASGVSVLAIPLCCLISLEQAKSQSRICRFLEQAPSSPFLSAWIPENIHTYFALFLCEQLHDACRAERDTPSLTSFSFSSSSSPSLSSSPSSFHSSSHSSLLPSSSSSSPHTSTTNDSVSPSPSSLSSTSSSSSSSSTTSPFTSFLHCYISTLPASFPTCPLLYPAQLLSILSGSQALTMVQMLRADLIKDYNDITTRLAHFEQKTLLQIVSWPSFLWARLVVLSRLLSARLTPPPPPPSSSSSSPPPPSSSSSSSSPPSPPSPSPPSPSPSPSPPLPSSPPNPPPPSSSSSSPPTPPSSPSLSDNLHFFLAPLADMLDHRHQRNLTWGMQADAKGSCCLNFKARSDIAAGDELFISYGTQDNWRYFIHYGFVQPSNRPHNTARLQLRFIGDEHNTEFNTNLRWLQNFYENKYGERLTSSSSSSSSSPPPPSSSSSSSSPSPSSSSSSPPPPPPSSSSSSSPPPPPSSSSSSSSSSPPPPPSSSSSSSPPPSPPHVTYARTYQLHVLRARDNRYSLSLTETPVTPQPENTLPLSVVAASRKKPGEEWQKEVEKENKEKGEEEDEEEEEEDEVLKEVFAVLRVYHATKASLSEMGRKDPGIAF